jgi:hypothetical protein
MGLLEELTGKSWEEVEGPDTHVGVDSYYESGDGTLAAWINVDQTWVTVKITSLAADANGRPRGAVPCGQVVDTQIDRHSPDLVFELQGDSSEIPWLRDERDEEPTGEETACAKSEPPVADEGGRAGEDYESDHLPFKDFVADLADDEMADLLRSLQRRVLMSGWWLREDIAPELSEEEWRAFCEWAREGASWTCDQACEEWDVFEAWRDTNKENER